MKIELRDLTVLDLVAGNHDDGEGGVVGYGGKLGRFYDRGDRKYARIIIRNKRQKMALIG